MSAKRRTDPAFVAAIDDPSRIRKTRIALARRLAIIMRIVDRRRSQRPSS
jgi:hypothetical protein